MQQHDEEKPLLDTKRHRNNERLSRRLSIAAIIISLINICFQAYIFYMKQRIVVSHDTIHFDPVANDQVVFIIIIFVLDTFQLTLCHFDTDSCSAV